ncbi:pilus assembly protein TadG-related protein [Gimesia sp.]|uniref:pilus assembly protein TadG-related protein n=1 Tax=Gimesia sp. TaxID=2024833 RepID=UPI003A9542DC
MRQQSERRGAIAVFTAILLVPLLGMVAFAVDYGYLLKKRADLQRAADAAVLAAVRDLVPDVNGTQDLAKVKATLRQYADLNIQEIENFQVLDADIQIGRYDPESVYDNFTIVDWGTFDTVRVTLRFDTQANSPVSLFFARLLGINESDLNATSTAILQKGSLLAPGVGVMPFTIPKAEWDTTEVGEIWTIYGDGRLEDNIGAEIPGNWGTCDIGKPYNSTSDIRDQIDVGLRQEDLDALAAEGRNDSTEYIDSSRPMYLNGDPGISTGMKSAVVRAEGKTKLIPIYDSVMGNGSGVEFHVVGWAVCEVINSHWGGDKNTYVKIKKSYTYDSFLRPNTDLRSTDGVVEGAFAAAALVQ